MPQVQSTRAPVLIPNDEWMSRRLQAKGRPCARDAGGASRRSGTSPRLKPARVERSGRSCFSCVLRIRKGYAAGKRRSRGLPPHAGPILFLPQEQILEIIRCGSGS